MNKINDKKIDLVEEISKASNVVRSFDNHSRKAAFRYFLNEDIEKVFGKTTFDKSENEDVPDEIDITRMQNGLLISDLDGNHYRITFRSDGLDAHKIIVENNNMSDIKEVIPLFNVTITPIIYSNTLRYDKEVEERTVRFEDNYEINTNDLTFNFKSSEKGMPPYYEASISSLNAKFNSLEMLNYMRITPPYDKNGNILKRMAKYFKTDKMDRGECIVSLATSDDLTDLTDYSDKIFGIFKGEAVRMLRPSDGYKSLQKMNEEN